MITWFNNLNLKPQERRLVIGALVVGFILVNVWFVWPHFGDWAKNSRKAEDAELAVTRYQKEVNNIPRYKTLIKELEKGGSVSIAAAEQAIQFQKTIQEIANRSGVSINRYDPANPRRGTVTGNNNSNSQTNAFFEESGLLVQMQQVEEKDLVLFLYNLGSGNSNIRVKELELSPHNTGTKLVCKALLIASYQKAQTNKNSMLAPAAKPVGTAAVNKNSTLQNTVKTNTASTTKTNLDNSNKTKNQTVEKPAAETKTAGKKDTE
jgi:hypothetical protein